jgi:hypothetical protein
MPAEIMRRMRATEADPELRRLYLNLAGEIVTAGTANDAHILDDDFLELDADTRDAFLADQARTLAPWLLRAALAWTIFEADTVADWREMRGVA